mgnify:CR=1 FL=1
MTAAGAYSDRITRLEEHLRTQDEKLDKIIRLTEAQDEKIKGLTNEMARIAPTVKAGEEVFSTARNIGGIAKWTFWFATCLVAFLVYMADRWHVVGQLFRKAT